MGPFAVSIKSLTLPLIDRYLFRQLLVPTILATVALAAIGVLSQSLSALDVLVDERQGLMVFAKVALLAMPQLMVIILPVAILVAGLAALNRLHTEQEIVICFAGGMSRWSVIAPALRLSLLIALASLVLSLWVQPYCFRVLRQTLQEVRADLAAVLVTPGRFTHPAPGVTVYAQSVSKDGLIRNLFIDIADAGGRDTTLTAREGRVQTQDGKLMLILRHGASQEISPAGVLNFLAFDEYPFDLRPFVASDRTVQYKLSDRYPHELFFPDYRQPWGARQRRQDGRRGPLEVRGRSLQPGLHDACPGGRDRRSVQQARLCLEDRGRGRRGAGYPHAGIRRPSGRWRPAGPQCGAVPHPTCDRACRGGGHLRPHGRSASPSCSRQRGQRPASPAAPSLSVQRG